MQRKCSVVEKMAAVQSGYTKSRDGNGESFCINKFRREHFGGATGVPLASDYHERVAIRLTGASSQADAGVRVDGRRRFGLHHAESRLVATADLCWMKIQRQVKPHAGPIHRRMMSDMLKNCVHAVARPKRFELLTPRFVVWCSIQLSYGRLPFHVGSPARQSRGTRLEL